jgi:hypothetical protein
MTNYPYILFNQSPEQLRQIGARGGRAYGRNERARRRSAEQTAAPAVPSPAPSMEMETVAQAIAILDAQFPWLSECAFGAPKAMKTRRSSSKAE